MAKRNRITLKKFFVRGKMPTEEYFSELIDSVLNIVDEGLDKSAEKELSLSPLDEDGHIVSISRKFEDKDARWSIVLGKESENLSFQQFEGKKVLTIAQNKKVGFCTYNPIYQIYTTKTAGFYGRTGTYASGTIPDDEQWHAVTSELKGCFAFEVMAGCEKIQQDKYALLIATAIQCFGNHPRIEKTLLWYRNWVNRIKIRWKKRTDNQMTLQLKTRCDYGSDNRINSNLSSLWDNHKMNSERKEPSSNA